MRGGAMAEIGRKRKAKRQRGTAKETKPRRKKVKGYGVDLLRTAAERRMAESSEELAEAMISKALEGRMDNVKMLMKLGEEEKERRLEVRDGEAPGLADIIVGSTMRVGQVWDGTRWKRVRKGKTVEGGPEPERMSLDMCIREAMIDSGKYKEEDFKEEEEEIPDCEAPFPSPGLLYGGGR